jgi:GMP synthase-like glutamine amidotransferase
MRIHSLEHVFFEDPANIGVWAEEKGHVVSRTLFFQESRLPEMDEFDWLIIMGGPMNIYEEGKYPWLIKEKEFIGRAIREEKILLGICLGAQLIADVLGGKVAPNSNKEIGWFPITLTAQGRQSPFFEVMSEEFMAFHWHGDTFTNPPGAIRAAASKGCANQAFVWGSKVVALQFHLDSTRQSIQNLIENCRDEIQGGPFIQSPEQMLGQEQYLQEIRRMLWTFLDRLGREKV